MPGWINSIGGLEGAIRRSEDNLAVIADFVSKSDWLSFLAQIRIQCPCERLSVCRASPDQVKEMTKLLETKGVAFDIGAYRDAPPGLRIWCGHD